MALEENIRRRRRILANIHPDRRLADPLNPLDIPEECVRERYRFRPHTILYIADMLRGELERPTARAGALPVILQVCVALRFLATGAFQIVVGDTLRLSKASVCRVVRQFCVALSRRMRDFIRFPQGNEAQDVIQGFHQSAGTFIYLDAP